MKYLHLGIQMALTVLAFGALGWWLDQRWAWSPWGVVGGLSLGSAIAMYLVIREAFK